jgi:hypothetical protein
MRVEITNWKEVVDQFGYEPKDGLRSCKEISRLLSEECRKLDNIFDEPNLAVSCSRKGEAIALFKFIKVDSKFINNGRDEIFSAVFYEFTGTAN